MPCLPHHLAAPPVLSDADAQFGHLIHHDTRSGYFREWLVLSVSPTRRSWKVRLFPGRKVCPETNRKSNGRRHDGRCRVRETKEINVNFQNFQDIRGLKPAHGPWKNKEVPEISREAINGGQWRIQFFQESYKKFFLNNMKLKTS